VRRPRRLAPLLLAIAFASGCASRRPAPPATAQLPPAETTAPAFEEGLASWYGGNDGFEGKPTASGERYDSSHLTAAHRELPLGTVVDVTNVADGRTVRVRVNDRGPFVKGRIIDLSREAARRIGVIGPGVAPVRLSVVSSGTVQELAAATGLWVVQVGSFAQPGRADRHAERVRAAGFEPRLERFQGLTRVKIGPAASREDAEDRLRALEDAGFEGIVVPDR
jgi:rare lipoprotein A